MIMINDSFSYQNIMAELQKYVLPDTTWTNNLDSEVYKHLKTQLIAHDYVPGLGPNPCSNMEEGLQKISKWLYYEFKNRLDKPAPSMCRESIRQVASLLCTQLKHKSKPEIRAAIEFILRNVGFPALSKKFEEHNYQVDYLTSQYIKALNYGDESTTASWMQILAAANFLEIWPGTQQECINNVLRKVFESRNTSETISSIVEIIEKKLRKSAPIGLLTDNHGEIMVDLAFLLWLQQRYPHNKLFIFPKAFPVETDIDFYCVKRIIQNHYPRLVARVVSNGSPIQGTLLTQLEKEFLDAFLEIKNGDGILFVKGLANLETVLGIQIDAVFLFALKTPMVANVLKLKEGSVVGIWVPSGKKLYDSECHLVTIIK